ncbi:pseudaminic acid cytidylyltransferase [Gammaproteobacteria bacterium]|jgi:pseudaminic acid cytidylyltransferase|nr:pseudaminic acid cytidylyltransferase [Gammaproteobacteria bacterium]MDC0129014.1 pseudaminic acid cytidylyltransferase [Gammaproteobacteria bacterium]
MKLAVIPARGGSKRIPKKNIKLFCGKPMIVWSILAAKKSNLFDYIIVSTDDEEIAEISLENGAIVPFIRPKELSDDIIGTGPVVKHAVEWSLKNIGSFDYVATIYATAPFIEPTDIINGFNLLLQNDCQISFTVTSFPSPIQRAIKINEVGRVSMFQPQHFLSRSQDLEPAYHDAGQLYWASTNAVLEEVSAFSQDAIAQVLPRHKVQDIDTMEDWQLAELMFKAWHYAE